MRSKQRAFTIIEALVAIVVLIGVLLALLGIIPQTFSNAERDAQRGQALGAAQQYLDTLREYVAHNKFAAANLPSPAPASIDAGDTFAGSVAVDLFTLVYGQVDFQSTPNLLLSIPFAVLALVLLIELGFRRGTEGPNRFGPDPLSAQA